LQISGDVYADFDRGTACSGVIAACVAMFAVRRRLCGVRRSSLGRLSARQGRPRLRCTGLSGKHVDCCAPRAKLWTIWAVTSLDKPRRFVGHAWSAAITMTVRRSMRGRARPVIPALDGQSLQRPGCGRFGERGLPLARRRHSRLIQRRDLLNHLAQEMRLHTLLPCARSGAARHGRHDATAEAGALERARALRPHLVLFDCGEGTQVPLRAMAGASKTSTYSHQPRPWRPHSRLPGLLLTLANSSGRSRWDRRAARLERVLRGLMVLRLLTFLCVRVGSHGWCSCIDLDGMQVRTAFGEHHVPCIAYRLDVPAGAAFLPDRRGRSGAAGCVERLQRGLIVTVLRQGRDGAATAWGLSGW